MVRYVYRTRDDMGEEVSRAKTLVPSGHVIEFSMGHGLLADTIRPMAETCRVYPSMAIYL